MSEYLGNVFGDIERILNDDRIKVKWIVLDELQMCQAIRLISEVTEAKNELVRENWRLAHAEQKGT